MYLFDYICVYYPLQHTNTHIILKYILCNIFFIFLLPTCFDWPQSSGSLQPNGLKLTTIHNSYNALYIYVQYSND